MPAAFVPPLPSLHSKMFGRPRDLTCKVFYIQQVPYPELPLFYWWLRRIIRKKSEDEWQPLKPHEQRGPHLAKRAGVSQQCRLCSSLFRRASILRHLPYATTTFGNHCKTTSYFPASIDSWCRKLYLLAVRRRRFVGKVVMCYVGGTRVRAEGCIVVNVVIEGKPITWMIRLLDYVIEMVTHLPARARAAFGVSSPDFNGCETEWFT